MDQDNLDADNCRYNVEKPLIIHDVVKKAHAVRTGVQGVTDSRKDEEGEVACQQELVLAKEGKHSLGFEEHQAHNEGVEAAGAY